MGPLHLVRVLDAHVQMQGHQTARSGARRQGMIDQWFPYGEY